MRLRYLLGGDRPSQTARLRGYEGLANSVIVRAPIPAGWYLKVDSTPPARRISTSPTYPAQLEPAPNLKLQSSFIGSFCPGAGCPHLHRHFYFTESPSETAPKSLRLSCGSELTRQGISLP